MYASVLQRSGPTEPLHHQRVAVPLPGPDEVLIQVYAASLDRVDNYIRQGSHGMAVATPQTLGRDMAGVVTAVGANVRGFRAGDEVLALGSAAHAQYALAPYWHTLPKPPRWSFAEAAALPTAGRTAFDAIANITGLRSGERVLVVAASGAVGSFALQLGVHLGAEVYATAGQDWKRQTACSLGARAALNHYSADLVDEIRAAAGGAEMDVIIDPIGGELWERLLSVLAPGGRIVTCGVTAGARGSLHLGRLMTKGWHIHGIGRPGREEIAAHLRGCLDLMVAADQRPIVDRTFPLAEATAAHRYLEESNFFGRVVLTGAEESSPAP
ncbi:zinc-binding alcohol dehydrogenase family protein [Micromonospora rubida]|uniref:Zinc-binding alcohol dehydrogenase family protein n=1 Tax=Micromonospora rubida TaxID=2697657 RepID=A0ABW7SJL8_9ACTN